jgi:hypothetical protein
VAPNETTKRNYDFSIRDYFQIRNCDNLFKQNLGIFFEECEKRTINSTSDFPISETGINSGVSLTLSHRSFPDNPFLL